MADVGKSQLRRATPRSNPTIYNVTLIGDPDTNEGTASDDGMVLREGTAGTFRNFSALAGWRSDACEELAVMDAAGLVIPARPWAALGAERIVILSPHIVEDVRELCTRMAIIHRGEVRFSGSPDEAVASLEGRIWQRQVEKARLPDIEREHRIISSKLVAGRPVVHVLAEERPEDGFEPASVTLEDVFFTRIGKAD